MKGGIELACLGSVWSTGPLSLLFDRRVFQLNRFGI